MLAWSTDSLPQRERFEFWREERARRLFVVETELEKEHRLAFKGQIEASTVGSATLIKVATSLHTVRRTSKAIDRAPDESFYVGHVERGVGVTLVGDRTDRMRDGGMFTGLSDVPYSHFPDGGLAKPGAFVACRVMRIPLHVLPAIPGRPALQQDGGTAGLDMLLRSYFLSLVEQVPHLTGAAAEHAVRALAHLALAARGIGDIRDEPGVAVVREALVVRAQRLIDRDLHRSDLTPTRAAELLGVSVRKLHLAFEPTGESFSRRVLTRRLARANQLLADVPNLSVTEVAYASGFDSLATFFRCYRSAYGDSPRARCKNARDREA